MTITYNDHEYVVVRDWNDDERLAYREIGNGHIEMLSYFCGEYVTTTFHPTFAKLVMDQRQYQQEVERREAQEILNANKAAKETAA
jgi:hypothetical protein